MLQNRWQTFLRRTPSQEKCPRLPHHPAVGYNSKIQNCQKNLSRSSRSYYSYSRPQPWERCYRWTRVAWFRWMARRRLPGWWSLRRGFARRHRSYLRIRRLCPCPPLFRTYRPSRRHCPPQPYYLSHRCCPSQRSPASAWRHQGPRHKRAGPWRRAGPRRPGGPPGGGSGYGGWCCA